MTCKCHIHEVGEAFLAAGAAVTGTDRRDADFSLAATTWRIVDSDGATRTARAPAVRAPSRTRTFCGADRAHWPIAVQDLAPEVTAHAATSSTATNG